MDGKWLLGNSVEQPQWESSNAAVSYPLADDSLPDGFPPEALVDACIVVASETSPSEAKVELGCLHFSPHLISAMVFVDNEPALACSVPAGSYEPFSPIAMETLKEGCSGTISFGSVTDRGTYTFRGRIPFSDSAVVRPVVGRLRRFLKVATGQTATGDVGIELPAGVAMSVEDEGGVSTVTFTISDEARAALDAVCAGDDGSGLVPITSINGITPDDKGRIAIVFGDSDEEEGA